MHSDPLNLKVKKLSPMYNGSREKVHSKAKRPIHEMWVDADCLQDDVFSDNHGLGVKSPYVVRTGFGKTSQAGNRKRLDDKHRVVMYHIDLGRIFIHPKPVRLS